jgi:hypothetical protein
VSGEIALEMQLVQIILAGLEPRDVSCEEIVQLRRLGGGLEGDDFN